MNKRILLWVAIVLGLGIIGVLAALFLPGLKPSEAEVGIEDISDLPELSVKILSPEDGDVIKSDQPVLIFALSMGKQPVDEISFWVDGVLEGVVNVEEEWQGSYLAEIDWMPPRSGGYSLSVSVISEDGTTVGSQQVNIVVEKSRPTPTAAPTRTPEPPPDPPQEESGEGEEERYSRCDLFDPEKTSLIMLKMSMFINDLTLYIPLPTAVPGLEEDIPEDDQPWEYSARLGTKTSSACSYWGYTKRLYCTFEDLSDSFFDETHPLDVYVNLCDEPIYSHGWVSVSKPTCQVDFEEDACDWTGGEWECDSDDNCACTCP
jgi:hypothetical protein